MDPGIRSLVSSRLEADGSADERVERPRPRGPRGPATRSRPSSRAAPPRRSGRGARVLRRSSGAFLQVDRRRGLPRDRPAQTLELRPGPGLTLVVGRNGSGKSSFAEALEVLLTGDSLRWKERAAVWREGWRNLHHPAASLARDVPRRGRARTVRGRRGAGSRRRRSRPATATAQVHGKPASDLESLGWTRGAAHASALPLLQRAGLAARRRALEALRRALLDPRPRGPRRRRRARSRRPAARARRR